MLIFFAFSVFKCELYYSVRVGRAEEKRYATDLWHAGIKRGKKKKENPKSQIQELNPSDYDFATKQ